VRPGEETPDVMRRIAEADAIVRRFAQDNKIPLYTGRPNTMGPAPIVMVMALLIEENRHLQRMLDLILEPGK
jgi:hypothetical protein